MSHSILVTGATGAIGPLLLAELLRTDDFERILVLTRTPGMPSSSNRVTPLIGDIRRSDLGLKASAADQIIAEIDVIIHAAANTRFSAPEAELYADNVRGTSELLRLAARCRKLRQVLLVSTTCVAGTRTGVIAESIETDRPRVVNPYERTKWQAEQTAVAADLPIRIARLSTCVGDRDTGFVHRLGAIHHSLRWFARGLIPVLPGVDDSRLDLIPTDLAARWLARAATRPVDRLEVCHVAAGAKAVPLNDLLEFIVSALGSRGSSRRRIEMPLVVDAETFEIFERMVLESGDTQFGRVLESVRSFLPALLFPKVYETECAEACWGGSLPLGDWRLTLSKVIDFVLTNAPRVRGRQESTHA